MKVVVKKLVHESLECGWFIGEAKRHDKKLEIAMVGIEECVIDDWGWTQIWWQPTHKSRLE